MSIFPCKMHHLSPTCMNLMNDVLNGFTFPYCCDPAKDDEAMALMHTSIKVYKKLKSFKN